MAFVRPVFGVLLGAACCPASAGEGIADDRRDARFALHGSLEREPAAGRYELEHRLQPAAAATRSISPYTLDAKLLDAGATACGITVDAIFADDFE